MKNLSSILLAAGLALGLSGCFSVNTAPMPNGEEHVLVRNYGWYLFNFLPIGCGNANVDPRCRMVMFRDDVTMEKVQTRFLRYAAEKNRTPKDLSYDVTDDVMLTIPLLYIQLPIPYLVTYREVQLSGVLQ